jgi:cytochrome oxidase Cu insertion factor (SCO1/SenC/PrrC family)
MQFYKISTILLASFALVLGACTSTGVRGDPVADTGSQTMIDQGDDAMMDKDDAMMGKDDDVMMDKEGDAMMGKDDDAMMDKEDDAMMGKDDDAMMDKEDDTMMDKEDDTMMDKDDDTMMDKDDDTMMDKDENDVMDKDDDAMMEFPSWFDVSLTNVSSGDTFTIKDLKGKVVLVEPFAIWCPNCLQQQNQVKLLHEKLGDRNDFISIGLNVDPNENTEDIKAYIEQRGFDWIYVNAPAEVHREIGNLYGALYLNPSSTPVFIIDRQGAVNLLPFGIKSADSLHQIVQPLLDDDM